MKLFAVLIFMVVGSLAFANKTLHVTSRNAGPLFEALAAADIIAAKGVIELNGIDCVISREGQRGDPQAKWEYVTSFSCTLDASPSYTSQKPIVGEKAQAIITALNRAGIHTYKTITSPHTYVKSLFIQSLSCEKSQEKPQTEGDLLDQGPAVYACSVEI